MSEHPFPDFGKVRSLMLSLGWNERSGCFYSADDRWVVFMYEPGWTLAEYGPNSFLIDNLTRGTTREALIEELERHGLMSQEPDTECDILELAKGEIE